MKSKLKEDFDTLRTIDSYANIKKGTTHVIHKVQEVVDFVRTHPGCTEKEIQIGIYGVTPGGTQSNKAGADLIRRALEKGLIVRTNTVRVGRSIYTFFTPEDLEKFNNKKVNVGDSGLSVGNIRLKQQESANKIREIKRLVNLVEAKSGLKIQFEEKKIIKESISSNWQAKLDNLYDFINYQSPVIIDKINNGQMAAKYFTAFVSQLKHRINGIISTITDGVPETNKGLEEDINTGAVDMKIEDAVEDPQDLKKLTDKRINVNLTDKDDKPIIATTTSTY